MTTTQINTAELSGAALAWAVAYAICPKSFADRKRPDGLPYWSEGWLSGGIKGALDAWQAFGPLIDKYGIEFISEDNGFEATAWNDKRTIGCMGWGKDHLTAACRAIIAKELGETVSVPTELVEGGV